MTPSLRRHSAPDRDGSRASWRSRRGWTRTKKTRNGGDWPMRAGGDADGSEEVAPALATDEPGAETVACVASLRLRMRRSSSSLMVSCRGTHSQRITGVSARGTRTRVPPEGPRPSDKTGPRPPKRARDLSSFSRREEERARAIRTGWERTIGDSCSRSPRICISFLAWQHSVQVMTGMPSPIRQASVTAPVTTTSSTAESDVAEGEGHGR
jgi:hypothetical protein